MLKSKIFKSNKIKSILLTQGENFEFNYVCTLVGMSHPITLEVNILINTIITQSYLYNVYCITQRLLCINKNYFLPTFFPRLFLFASFSLCLEYCCSILSILSAAGLIFSTSLSTSGLVTVNSMSPNSSSSRLSFASSLSSSSSPDDSLDDSLSSSSLG